MHADAEARGRATLRHRNAIAALAAFALLAGAGCERLERGEGPEAEPSAKAAHQDLVMGYDLLAGTLSDESHLRALELFKKITFHGPVDEVAEAMKVIGKASKRRKKELEGLRRLAPDVTGKPTARSPIGDAIEAVAKEVGEHEMLGDSAFDVRFMLLQAQATRMVAAMATAIAEYEPNAERKKWLHEVAAEYEGHRNQIIRAIQKYIRGEGAAQRAD